MDKHTDTILALQEFLKSLPEKDRRFMIRFTAKRIDMSPEELAAEWDEEYGRRHESVELEKHRQKRLVDDLMSTPLGQKNRDALAEILGVEASATSAELTSETTE